MIELVGFCDDHDGAIGALLEIADKDTTLIIAMAQKIVDERKIATTNDGAAA